MSILRSLFAPEPAVIERAEPFGYMGNTYYGLARGVSYKGEGISADFAGLSTAGYLGNPVIFACMNVRRAVFTQARFQFRRIRNGRPGDYFGTGALDPLEKPWANGSTSNLLARMINDADSGAGNSYMVRRPTGIKRARPDWMSIVIGSESDPDVDSTDLDAEIIGFIYQPGGAGSGREPVPLLPDEVAHFAPYPDPLASFRGVSWLTSVLRELEADTSATLHKGKFFEGGATPRAVVRFGEGVSQEAANAFADRMDAVSAGWENAYKTLYVGQGADVTTIGADLRQLDFKTTQGAGETRIAAAAGCHPTIVGLSEGLQGSSLNAGNFGAARRLVSDITMQDLWRNAAGALSNIIDVPTDAELACDPRDIPFLREDIKERAEVQEIKATTINTLVTAGFTPESSAAAVEAEDMTLLQHTGLTSVQLTEPGSSTDPAPQDAPPMGVPAMNGSSNGQGES